MTTTRYETLEINAEPCEACGSVDEVSIFLREDGFYDVVLDTTCYQWDERLRLSKDEAEEAMRARLMNRLAGGWVTLTPEVVDDFMTKAFAE